MHATTRQCSIILRYTELQLLPPLKLADRADGCIVALAAAVPPASGADSTACSKASPSGARVHADNDSNLREERERTQHATSQIAWNITPNEFQNVNEKCSNFRAVELQQREKCS